MNTSSLVVTELPIENNDLETRVNVKTFEEEVHDGEVEDHCAEAD